MEDFKNATSDIDNTWLRNIFVIERQSSLPIYQQLVNAIVNAIEEQMIKKGDALPSINQVSSQFEISRSTVEKAFNQLRKMSYVGSAPGKGYFVMKTPEEKNPKVLILLNNQSNYNKFIYDSFVRSLTPETQVDCFVYNNNVRLFSRLKEKTQQDYTDFVIIPHVDEDFQNMFSRINNLSNNKLMMLKKFVNEISEETFPANK